MAGISLAWRASESSVDAATRSALEEARRNGFTSVALPLIGTGTGGVPADRVIAVMLRAINEEGDGLRVVLVRYRSHDAMT